MHPNLAHYVNKTVLIAIPILYGDTASRAHTLLATESNGLWLQSEDLARRLLPKDAPDRAAHAHSVFVPFAQIGAVLIATAMPAWPQPPVDKAAPREQPATSKTRVAVEPGNAGAAKSKQSPKKP